MSEEKSPEDRKSESLPDLSASPQEVNENISQEQTIEQQIEQSEIPLVSGATNHKPQTEYMEVHHHPKVEKKNFKEYFLEFLMIFLAVTMGFFAENIREKITDNNKEKE